MEPERTERKNSGLSSQNRNDRLRSLREIGKGKGRKEGDARNRKKASTCGTAVGVKQGRTKGNKQEAEYRKPEEKVENGETERKNRALRKPL